MSRHEENDGVTQDLPEEIYVVKARVQNHMARLMMQTGGGVTQAGTALTNMFTHVLMDLRNYAKTLPEPYSRELLARLESHEEMPAQLLKVLAKK